MVDNALNDVAPGAGGESLIKGPTVFLEYKDNPVETTEAKSFRWLASDGRRCSCRKKELIKFRGNQISRRFVAGFPGGGCRGVWSLRQET